MRNILMALIIILIAPSAFAATLFQDNFDGYSDSPAIHGWTLGSQFSVSSSGGRGGGRCLVVHYGDGVFGTNAYSGNIDPYTRGALGEGYVRFSFKVVGNSTSSNFQTKFFKLHARVDGDNSSNYTVMFLDNYVQTGNGALAGDAQCRWDFDGSIYSACTHNSYTGTAFTLNDEGWHTFEMYFKYNTNGASDGELRVWFDGNEHLHVTGMKNRNDGTPRDANILDLSAYRYTGDPDNDWYIYYDDIVVADTYIGPPSQSSSPTPPTQPSDNTAPSAPEGVSTTIINY